MNEWVTGYNLSTRLWIKDTLIANGRSTTAHHTLSKVRERRLPFTQSWDNGALLAFLPRTSGALDRVLLLPFANPFATFTAHCQPFTAQLYRTMSSVYRALSSLYRALSTLNRTLSSLYRTLSSLYRSLVESLPLTAACQSFTAHLQPLPHTFKPLPLIFNLVTLTAFNQLPRTFKSLSSPYEPYRSLSTLFTAHLQTFTASFHPVTANFNPVSLTAFHPLHHSLPTLNSPDKGFRGTRQGRGRDRGTHTPFTLTATPLTLQPGAP